MPLFKPRVEKYLNKRDAVRLGAILKTGSAEEREAAARALEELAEEYRTERNVYGLESVLANVDSKSRVRKNVDRAFKQLIEDLQREGDVDKLQFVLLLNDPGKGGPTSVAVRAAQALGEVGDPRALQILEGHRAIDRYVGKAVRETIEMISPGTHSTSEKTRQLTGEQVTQQARKGSRRGKDPRCSVCGIAHSEIVERAEEVPGVVAIGKGVGVCPTCLKAFCVNHMIRANPHDYIDNEKCPNDRTDLDLDWERPWTPERPWRTGEPIKGSPVLQAIADRDYSALLDAYNDVEEVEGPLIDALSAPDPRTREFAAHTAGQLFLDGVAGSLAMSLSDEDAEVRKGAASALMGIASIGRSAIGGGEVAPALLDPLNVDRIASALTDTERRVRICAAEALGDIGDERAVSALVAALADEDEFVRDEAAKALSQIGGAEAERALKERPQHPPTTK